MPKSTTVARRWFGVGALSLLVIVLLALPFVMRTAFELRLMTVIFLYATLGHGWNILVGLRGKPRSAMECSSGLARILRLCC